MSKSADIAMPVVRRLPRYYRFLLELEKSGVSRISSRELADKMGLTASQIRQDLNCFGGFGQQGYGYIVAQLREEIGRILGLDRAAGAVLIGAGNIGTAIAKQLVFSQGSLSLCGIFDKAPSVIGRRLVGLRVQGMDELDAFCAEQQPQVGILCVPDAAANEVVSQLMAHGVRAFWNFTHYDVALHFPGTVVENVHLEDSLMTLRYRLCRLSSEEQESEQAPF